VTVDLGALVVFLGLVAVVATAGVAFGILVLAPRLTRHADRTDEESGGRDD
jgi:hypothetical protein